jgi:ABC-2 type transport system permease protein
MSINKLFAFVIRDFKIETSYRLFFILRFVRIFIGILTFYFISRLFKNIGSVYLKDYGGEYFPFVLLGLAFSEYLNVSLRTFSENIRHEQLTGTLEAILATPTSLATFVIGSSLWNFIFATINVGFYIFCAVLFFGLNLSQLNLMSAIIMLILTLISFSSLGIISAGFILVLKRGDPLSWFLGMSFGFLGGVYFPVEILPPFLKVFSYLLPVTYSLRGIRLAFLKGYNLNLLRTEIGVLFLFSIFLFPLGIWIFKLALKKAKLDGSLTHY